MNIAPRWCWAVAVGALPVAWLLARTGHGMSATPPSLQGLAGLVLLAAAEELVFRGGLQTALAKKWSVLARQRWGLSGANLLTSVVFSVAHLWAHAPLQAAMVFPVSLLLGASLEQSHRLRVPVALHIWFNLALYGMSGLQGVR